MKFTFDRKKRKYPTLDAYTSRHVELKNSGNIFEFNDAWTFVTPNLINFKCNLTRLQIFDDGCEKFSFNILFFICI